MIIDIHTHIGEPYSRTALGQCPPRVTADTLVQRMDEAGIKRAVTFTEKGLWSYDKTENDKIASGTRKHPDRLIGFATVHPRYGEDSILELRRAILTLGLKGLKLHPWMQAFSCTERILDPLFDEIVKLKIPVLFHTGYDPFSGPLGVADLAERYPEAPIIIGHSGILLWYDTIKAAMNCDNLYLETSGILSTSLEKAIHDVGAERVLFGSDTPWHQSAMEILKIRTLNISDREKELILGGNLERLLRQWRVS